MQRPPTELRKLEDEERRRDRAHRRLRWERRLRVARWVVGGLALLFILALIARLTGFPLG
jgi:hypothetical protein